MIWRVRTVKNGISCRAKFILQGRNFAPEHFFCLNLEFRVAVFSQDSYANSESGFELYVKCFGQIESLELLSAMDSIQ